MYCVSSWPVSRFDGPIGMQCMRCGDIFYRRSVVMYIMSGRPVSSLDRAGNL